MAFIIGYLAHPLYQSQQYVRFITMLSPCSILSNNISIVTTLRRMLENQVQSQQGQASPKSTILERLNSLRQQSTKVKSQLQELKHSVSLNTFATLVPEEYRHFLAKSEGGSRTTKCECTFDDKQNKQTNVQPLDHNLKSVYQMSHASSQTSKLKSSHTLRSKIFKDLEDLKRMEEKQKILTREINLQKLNRDIGVRVNTEYKRRPLEEVLGINETRSVDHSQSRDETFVTEESLESHITESVITPIQESNIIVPTLHKLTTNNNKNKSLLCPLKHQYYSGELVDGVPNGKGRLFVCCHRTPIPISDGAEFYSGGFRNGRFQGYGTLVFKNGTKFVGMFKNGLRHGDGSIYYKGSVEMGRWNYGKLSNKI